MMGSRKAVNAQNDSERLRMATRKRFPLADKACRYEKLIVFRFSRIPGPTKGPRCLLLSADCLPTTVCCPSAPARESQ
jgi:hypothetical protein